MNKPNSYKEYDYADLHPGHVVFSKVNCWDGLESEFVNKTCIDDAIEEAIDDCHPTPIKDIGTIQISGFAWQPDCPEDEYPAEGEPIIQICLINVDALEWSKENRPDWLKEETIDEIFR